MFFLGYDCSVIGGQCKSCHSILWVNSRTNVILNESKPVGVTESGADYTKYYDEKLKRFLLSLPACPECNSLIYDKFVNNVQFPRFSDGTECDFSGNEKIIKKSEGTLVWYIE